MLPEPDVIPALSSQIQAAAAASKPIRLRGGGSKDFYGEALKGEILDTSALNGVVSYEPSELVITVLAGTPLAEVEALLAGHNQCFAFEPPHFGAGKKSTVGGMVASGLSGPARASVGAVRDYMLGVKLINGRGEHLTFGGQVMKNVAGYDVSRLMAGSLGTLGLITEVSLKVLPIAPAEATLRFECSQQQALQWLNSWGGQPLPLNASCWVEDAGVGTLYLRLRGALAAVEAACKTLGGERKDNAEVAADWLACRDQTLPWFADRAADQDLWRLSVPQAAPVLDLPEPPLIEWHGAQRWVRAGAGQGHRLRELAAAVGGSSTLFAVGDARHADGIPRFDALKPPLDKIHRQLKHEFDPAGIFNPGRMNRGW
ncbi:MAG: glycolate oxidase subunit GlcE [Pseudomonadota bacterium]